MGPRSSAVTMISYTTWSTMGYCPGKVCVVSPTFCSSFMCLIYNSPQQCLPMLVEKKKSMQPNLISCQDLFNLATVMVLTIIHPLSSLTWWSDHMKTLSALPTLCQGNPLVPSGFPSHRTSNVKHWCFHCGKPVLAVAQTVELPDAHAISW